MRVVQIVCGSPHKTLAGKFSRLAGKSFAGPGKVSNVMKIVVNRRSDSAALNSAAISTQPATDFHVGISTPEFRRDDATLKYDVTLRQLSLSSCPNPIRAISCFVISILVHPRCLTFVSRGVGILLRWWRSFNRVGWEYRQPLR